MVAPLLIANEASNSSIAVYWSPFVNYDFSNISYKIKYFITSSNISYKTGLTLSTNYLFNELLPNKTYTISLHIVVLSVTVLNIDSIITVKTKTGISILLVSVC